MTSSMCSASPQVKGAGQLLDPIAYERLRVGMQALFADLAIITEDAYPATEGAWTTIC
jgi:hypothetical protein